MIEIMEAPYLDGGRDESGIDCWGLVLWVRRGLGLPELPSIGGTIRTDKLSASKYYARISATLDAGESKPGSIAAVIRGGLFIHAGVVIEADGRKWVIDINPGSTATLSTIDQFCSTHFKVVFYNDKYLPEQA